MPSDNDVDKKTVGKAFIVEINGQFVPVKSYSGGDPQAEKALERPSPLKIEFYVTADNRIVAKLANAILKKRRKNNFVITIKELARDRKTIVRTIQYLDCSMHSYELPELLVTKNQALVEKAVIQARRRRVIKGRR